MFQWNLWSEKNKNMENTDNIKNTEEVEITTKKTGHGKTLPILALIIAIIFISAGTGAIFGFLASKDSAKIFSIFKNKGISELFSRKDASENNIIKQKIVQEDSAVIDVVKNSAPAVVSIVISRDVPKIQNFGNLPNFFGTPFEFYFGPQSGGTNDDLEGTRKQTIGGGTGFFITKDGMIVTNRHVVDDSSADYTVVTNDDKEYPAKVLAVDPNNDIAIIKIEGDNFTTLELGDSDSIQIGQTVVAIGNSLGEFSNTVSRGIISGLKRSLTAGDGRGQAEKLNNIIQTDAAINPGNSGGPLLNIDGQVIGVSVAIAQGAQNIGFAIPVNQVKKITEQVKKTGKISTPYLGVRYVLIDKALQKENDLPYNYGALVARGDKITDFAVMPGSPADKADLVENDIVLEIDGKKISAEDSENDLSSLISQYSVNDIITLKIWHTGVEKNIEVKLVEKNKS
ncbi:MAG: Protease Do [Candidatus Moranbacteria bacterium GW2011_GWF2_36_839]|nr:MAG: Protease Do [Candidatus Moranbacteria bacterium GW2011_GWF1_36_78]KKQ17772.1 MAG: Protease Do [Candidatus Moranbacteria bacterium GW2011_GWF2_36_839]